MSLCPGPGALAARTKLGQLDVTGAGYALNYGLELLIQIGAAEIRNRPVQLFGDTQRSCGDEGSQP